MSGTGELVHDAWSFRKVCDCSAYGDMRPGAVNLNVTDESRKTEVPVAHGSSRGGDEASQNWMCLSGNMSERYRPVERSETTRQWYGSLGASSSQIGSRADAHVPTASLSMKT